MSQFLFEDVKDFHKKMKVPIRNRPQWPPVEEMELRIDLIMEEWTETLTAIGEKDLTEVADGLIDLVYITMGALFVMGMPAQEIWDEVHKTNMAKIPACGDSPGETKIKKPEGWEPPAIRELLIKAGANFQTS